MIDKIEGWLWLYVAILWLVASLAKLWQGESATPSVIAMMCALMLMKMSGRKQ